MSSRTVTGACHCNAIKLSLELSKPVNEIWVRKCPCSFCMKQGNFNIADPDGLLIVTLSTPNETGWYQMGHKTSNRLFCKTCGVYIGGFMEYANNKRCVLNMNVLDDISGFTAPTEIQVLQQSPEERILGRLSRWMPYELL